MLLRGTLIPSLILEAILEEKAIITLLTEFYIS